MRILVNFPWKEMMDEWKIFVLKMFFHQHEILEGFFLVHLSRKLRWAILIEICPLSVVTFLYSSLEPLGQFQPNLAQSILRWRGFKLTLQIRNIQFSKIRFSLSLSPSPSLSLSLSLNNHSFAKCVCYLEMFLRWAMWPMGLLFFLVTFNRNIKVRRKYNNDSRLLQ